MNFNDTSIKTTAVAATLRKAVGLAAYLLDEFGDSLDFYRQVETPVVERWMRESYPEVIERLEEQGAYEHFRSHLDGYRENLCSAACEAEYILEYGSQDSSEDGPGHIIFSGLISRLPADGIAPLDEKSLLLALMVDKHRKLLFQNRHDYSVHSVARHSDIWLPKSAWGRCDIVTATNKGADVAYILPREHFPPGLQRHTHEAYALVINVPSWVAPSTLVTPTHMETVNIAVGTKGNERFLMLGNCPFLIPLVANEPKLALFRNHMPVLYLGDDINLLVEYPWNPVTDFCRCMYPHIHMDMPPETDDESVDPDSFREAHPNAIRISEIRPMPLLEGPVLPWRELERLRRERFQAEPIPF